jgi:hypothetical protein
MACYHHWVQKVMMYISVAWARNNERSENREIQEVEEDFIPVANIRSVGLKRSKSTS